MSKKRVQVELPLGIYHLLQEITEASDWTFQEVILQTIRTGLPPSLSKVPEAFHEELLLLNKFGDRSLLRVVEGELPPIEKLPSNFNVLRQTYALRLLKWRGHPVPPPYEAIGDQK